MTGPYDYVAPSYWLLDKTRGGAHGFNTETSPGPAIPPIESLRRMLPEDHLWPIDSWWDYHAGGGAFKDLKIFTTALDARYGPSTSVEEFARKAQVMAYEGHRAMFEAFGRNKYTSTGVIQWMLNNAWPSMIWHLYDWYLRPGGSYFGAKKANEPLHIQYSYDDASVVVVNSFYQAFPGMKARARVYNIDMTREVRQRRRAGCGRGQRHARVYHSRDRRLILHLLCAADFGGCRRQDGKHELLLAFDQAGRAGLGSVHLVLHAGEELSPTTPRSTACRRWS